MSKIVHLSSVHRSDDTRIYVKECQTLQAAGYDVTLIARPPDSGRTGDVPVVEVCSGAGNRLVRMTKTVWEVGRRAFAANADAYHFHDPELIPLGLLLKLWGKTVVYDVHETVPKQIMSKPWLPGTVRRPIATCVDLLERASSHAFDGIVAATPAIAERFPDDRTHVIQNFARLDEFLDISLDDYSQREALCAYVGSITETRGIRAMIDAIDRTDARLLLGGSFNPSTLKNEMTKLRGWQRVEHPGWLSRQDIKAAMARARLGLIVLKPEPNYLDSFPVKLFEYMAAGLPIVASNFPFWRQFVEETGAGLMVNPLDPAEISAAITWILEHPEEARTMGERGRQAAMESFSWDQEGAKLIRMYDRMFDMVRQR